MSAYTRAEAAWLEPDDEGPDPLEGVEHPRERKPGRRDRHAIYWRMQRAVNEREALTVRDFPGGWQHPTSLRSQSLYLNHAEHEVRRALLKIDDLGRMSPLVRLEFVARLRRYVLFAREIRLAAG